MTLAERKAKPRFHSRMKGGSIREWRKLRRLLTAYKHGADTREAAGAAGISLRTVDDWLQRGRNSEEPYDRFYAAVERLRSIHVLESITAISASRASDPNLALKWLQADPRTRDRYGVRVEQDSDAASVQVLGLLTGLLAQRTDARAVSASDTPSLPALPAPEDAD